MNVLDEEMKVVRVARIVENRLKFSEFCDFLCNAINYGLWFNRTN